MGALPPFKSETGTYVAGGTFQPKDWIKAKGPDGGRTVIDRLWIHFVGTLTTATAALLGEDVARIFGLVTVEDKSSVKRCNLLGDQLRVANVQLMGPGAVFEHADTGVGAAQVIDAWICVPLAKDYEFEPDDFSMGVDNFSGISLAMPAAADLSLGTSVVSAIAGTYVVIAECHTEFSVVAKLRDELKAIAFQSLTQVVVPLKGKPRDVIIHSRGAAGGTSLANMPTVRIGEFNMQPLTRDELRALATSARRNAPGAFATQGGEMRTDPFRTAAGVAGASALSVMRADPCDSNTRGEVLERMTIDTDNNTVPIAGLTVIVRQVLPQTDGELAEHSARFGTGGWRIKTADKSKRDPAAWSAQERRFLPKSAPLRGVRRGG